MSRRVRLATGGRIEEWCSLCGFQEPGFAHFRRHVANAFRPITVMVQDRIRVDGIRVTSTVDAGQAEVDAALAHRMFVESTKLTLQVKSPAPKFALFGSPS